MPINITTAIDSLVELVKTKKKITLEEASKELGIPENIINEWSNFLEEEGIMEKIYKFTTPYLVSKEKQEIISEEDLKQRLDLATRELEFMLSHLKKYQVEHKFSIDDIEDVRKLIKNPKKLTKDVVFAQKFIIEYEVNELLKVIRRIKLLTPELMDYIEKRIQNINKRKEIFKKNYIKIK